MPWQEVKKITKNLPVNEQIKAREVRVIDVDGTQIGVMALQDALEIARQKRMDLVNVAPNENPPVCRLMDFGKYKYEQSKREREARKKQKMVTIKEIRLRPKIEKHDFEVKLRSTRRFLESGDKVKVTVMFRGRELAHPEMAKRLCEEMARALQDCAVVERSAKLEGCNMIMILSPKS
ncbi:MAG TPA: translation initiation factor IF-3 [Bacillota bacterium]|nr:translation initiation factor IF-3 [Bacillota bacterium]